MTFDEKFKEGARASDAVDRLREVKMQLENEQDQKEQQHDWAVRFSLLVLIALIIGYAILRL
jgi:hypothetical protein